MTAQKSGADLAECGCVRQCEHRLSASILSDNDHRRSVAQRKLCLAAVEDGAEEEQVVGQGMDLGRERGSGGKMMGDLGISDKRLVTAYLIRFRWNQLRLSPALAHSACDSDSESAYNELCTDTTMPSLRCLYISRPPSPPSFLRPLPHPPLSYCPSPLPP